MMLCRFIFVIFYHLLGVSLAHLYAGDSNVINLTSSNFKKTVENSIKPVLTKFYNPQCPHCVNMVKAWREVARSLKGHVSVTAVDCSQGDPLCGRFRISGVPSIKLFIKDTKGDTVPIDYNEARSSNAIISFAKRHLASFVHKISRVAKTGILSLDGFLEKDTKLPHVILFKGNTAVASMPYKTLSVDFRGKCILGIVNRATDAELADKLGVTLGKEDTLVLIPAGAKKGIVYPGKNSMIEMKSFLEKELKSDKPFHSMEKMEL